MVIASIVQQEGRVRRGYGPRKDKKWRKDLREPNGSGCNQRHIRATWGRDGFEEGRKGGGHAAYGLEDVGRYADRYSVAESCSDTRFTNPSSSSVQRSSPTSTFVSESKVVVTFLNYTLSDKSLLRVSSRE